MEPETYQQAVSEGASEAAELVAALGRVVIGAVLVAACLLFAWMGSGSIVDRLNVFFAWVGDRRRPSPRLGRVLRWRLPVGRLVGAFVWGLDLFGFGIMVAVRAPVVWLVTSRLTALLTASTTVGVGVFLHGFHLVEIRWEAARGRGTRRFWHEPPEEMARALNEWVSF